LKTHSLFFIRLMSILSKSTFFTALILAHTLSLSAQQVIDSHSDYLNFISSIPRDDFGFLISSDGSCGECLLANDSTYLNKLDSLFSQPIAIVNSRSEFGRKISMKHRVNELPTILFLDHAGQLLRRVNQLPKTDDQVSELLLPFDTLPLGIAPLDFDLDYPEFLRKSYESGAQSYRGGDFLPLYFEMHPDLRDEVVWTVVMRFDMSESIMHRVITQRDTLIGLFGKKEVNEKLDEYFFRRMKAAARDRSESRLETILAQAGLAFGKDEFEYTSKYRSYFYQLTGNWDAYLNLGNDLKAKDSTSQTLYEMALVLLRYSNDEEILRSAAEWFSGELSEENLEEADLKTLLYWRGGAKNEAIQLASKIEALQGYSLDEFPYAATVLKETK